MSLTRNAANVQVADGLCLMAQGQPLLRVFPASAVTVSAGKSAMPGPLGGGPQLRHTMKVAGGASASFDLAISRRRPFARGGLRCRGEGMAGKTRLRSANPLPNPKLQYAFDASLRQMLMLIEAPGSRPRPQGLAELLRRQSLRHIPGQPRARRGRPRTDAEELLRHQIKHLKDDGIFEMWETGDLQKPGAEQWIVQGLAATALWNHYEVWRDEAWLREITPS